MGDGEHAEVQSRRTASTRMVVEAAVDFSNGANREMWASYRSRMADNIYPWRIGGFLVDDRAASEFMAGSRGARRA